MRHGIVLFASDRGITPAAAAQASEEAGFDTFYVPEHTHIPVRREAAHPGTGDETLPDDRYTRTLDPWISLATAAQATTRIRLATACQKGGQRLGIRNCGERIAKALGHLADAMSDQVGSLGHHLRSGHRLRVVLQRVRT